MPYVEMMDNTTPDITSICIPPENEAIGSALADLDHKLSTWTSAMERVFQQLRQIRHLEHAPDKAKARQKSSPKTDNFENQIVETNESASSSEGMDLTVQAKSDSSTDLDNATSCEMSSEHSDAAGSTNQPVASSDTNDIQTESAFAEQQKPIANNTDNAMASIHIADTQAQNSLAEQTQESALDDEETLLATLDEQIAKQVRIIRRLSPERKNIHTIIKEVQQNQQQTEKQQPRKKSWFRRKGK